MQLGSGFGRWVGGLAQLVCAVVSDENSVLAVPPDTKKHAPTTETNGVKRLATANSESTPQTKYAVAMVG